MPVTGLHTIYHVYYCVLCLLHTMAAGCLLLTMYTMCTMYGIYGILYHKYHVYHVYYAHHIYHIYHSSESGLLSRGGLHTRKYTWSRRKYCNSCFFNMTLNYLLIENSRDNHDTLMAMETRTVNAGRPPMSIDVSRRHGSCQCGPSGLSAVSCAACQCGFPHVGKSNQSGFGISYTHEHD